MGVYIRIEIGIRYGKKGIKIIFSGRREPLKREILDIIDDVTEKTKNNQNKFRNVK